MKRLIRSVRANVSAGKIWYLSCRAYKRGNIPLATALKALNYMLYHSVLCYQCEVEDDIYLVHGAMGSLVHPNVTIGKRVRFFHHVTLSSETLPGSVPRIVIEDDCVIGAHSIILGNDRDGVRIGRGAVIGAGAIVVRDVPPGATMVPMPARAVKSEKVYE